MSDSLTALRPLATSLMVTDYCHILRMRNKAREIITVGGLGIDVVQRLISIAVDSSGSVSEGTISAVDGTLLQPNEPVK